MNVDDFIASRPGTGGTGCQTCRHEKVEAINKDLRRFNDRRGGTALDAKGKPMPKAATSWMIFVSEHLQSEYDYKHDYRAAIRHLEKCLGEKAN